MKIDTKSNLPYQLYNSLKTDKMVLLNDSSQLTNISGSSFNCASKIYFQGLQKVNHQETLQNLLKASDIEESEHPFIIEVLEDYAPQNLKEQQSILKELLSYKNEEGEKFDSETIFNYFDYMKGRDEEERNITKSLMKNLLTYYSESTKYSGDYDDGMSEILFDNLNKNPQLYEALKEAGRSIKKYSKEYNFAEDKQEELLGFMFDLFTHHMNKPFFKLQEKQKIIDSTINSLIACDICRDAEIIDNFPIDGSKINEYFDLLAEKRYYNRKDLDCSVNSTKPHPHFAIIDDFQNKGCRAAQGYSFSHGTMVEGVVKISAPKAEITRIDLEKENQDINKPYETIERLMEKHKDDKKAYKLLSDAADCKYPISQSNVAFLDVIQRVLDGEKFDGVNYSYSLPIEWNFFEKLFSKDFSENFDERKLSEEDKKKIKCELENELLFRNCDEFDVKSILLQEFLVKELKSLGVTTYRSIGNSANTNFNLFSFFDTETIGATTMSGTECKFSQKSGDKTQEALGVYKLTPVFNDNRQVIGFSFFDDGVCDLDISDSDYGFTGSESEISTTSKIIQGTSFSAPRAMVENYYKTT